MNIELVKQGVRYFLDKSHEMLKEHSRDELSKYVATMRPLWPVTRALVGIEIATSEIYEQVLTIAENLYEGKSGNCQVGNLSEIDTLGLSALLGMELVSSVELYPDKLPSKAAIDIRNHFFAEKNILNSSLRFIDGRQPGFACLVGDTTKCSEIFEELKRRNLTAFVTGDGNEKELLGENIWQNTVNEIEPSEILKKYGVISTGKKPRDIILVINWIMRSASVFGKCRPGQIREYIDYISRKLPGFCIVSGACKDELIGCVTAFNVLGYPVLLTDNSFTKTADCFGEHINVCNDKPGDAVRKGIELSGIKAQVKVVDVPVPVSIVYQEEKIPEKDAFVTYGLHDRVCAALLELKPSDEVYDAKNLIIGKDLSSDQSGDVNDLAIHVSVYGRKMRKEYEPILERMISPFVSHAMGVYCIGARDMMKMVISKDSYDLGLRLRHLANIIYAKLHKEFGSLVDKIQVKIYTGVNEISEPLQHFREAYKLRDEKLDSLKDELTDEFYSCLICQSYSPNQVCIITPETPGLCGAYNYLDAKAGYELCPSGPNKPVKKGEVLNEKGGQWKGINEFVYKNSNNKYSRMNIYSLIENPPSSCLCAECILAIVPEVNGVIIVDKKYSGLTPLGLDFNFLLEGLKGSIQVAGFRGISRKYILSRKFLRAEGGIARIVWMPRKLLEYMRSSLQERAREEGLENFIEKIATEEVCIESEKLVQYLYRIEHPVLNMEPLL